MASSSEDKIKRTEQALTFLRQVKPNDGWSVDRYISASGKTLVMLRRRNVALVDVGFEELFHDENKSGSILGVMSYIESTDSSSSSTRSTVYARAMELVDVKGNIIRNPDKSIHRITLTPANGGPSKEASAVPSSSTTQSPSFSSSSVHTESTMTEEDYKQLLQYALIGLGSLVLLKLIVSTALIYFLILPLVILYALQTCPPVETFDAKKELKRVLRGKYLPEEQQPKDWLSKTMVRVQATIGTELMTGLGGYESQFINVMGICILSILQVPLLNKEYIWLGVFSKWIYIYHRDVPKATEATHTLRPPVSK